MNEHFAIDAWARSDTGRVRPANEDAFHVDLGAGYAAVADGMGGAAAGEVASRIFLEAAEESFRNCPQRSEAQILARVEAAFRLADRAIFDHTQRIPEHRGMGCTAELIAFWDRGYVLGHIGDSRAYRLRGGALKQLTRDHSLVQQQLEAGLITADGARTHPLKHVILQAVGLGDPIELDLIRGPVAPGDQFLLCTDGLTNLVENDVIEAVLRSPASLEEKADRLIERALENGGHDNVTVVILALRPFAP